MKYPQSCSRTACVLWLSGVIGTPAAVAQVQVPSAEGQTRSAIDPLEQALRSADTKNTAPWICVTGAVQESPRAGLLSNLLGQLSSIESHFNLIERKFGSLTVLAPATMTILSVDFPPPDLYADLPRGDAFKLLVASLNDSQWQLLVSDNGLSAPDLTTENQTRLWKAVLNLPEPPEPVLMYKPGNSRKPGPGTDVTDKVAEIRMQLKRRLDVGMSVGDRSAYMMPLRSGTISSSFYLGSAPNAPRRDSSFDPNQVLPNDIKKSDLMYDDARFDKPVSLANAKDVRTLLFRIGSATKTEIYCDIRMATMHVSASRDTVRAGDVLKALAFGVTGTYRQVGPAYVLTNDLLGLGRKMLLISDYKHEVENAQKDPLGEAGDEIVAKHSVADLPLNGDKSLDITDEQVKFATKANPQPFMDRVGPYFSGPLSGMTAAQKAIVQPWLEGLRKAAPGPEGSAKVDGDLSITSAPELHLVIPGVDGYENHILALDRLFAASSATLERQFAEQNKQAAGVAPKNVPKQPDAIPPSTLISQFVALSSRRAILVAPHNSAEAVASVQKAKALGFNQVWVDVLSATAHPDPYSAGALNAADLRTLNAVIKAGAANGIAVFAHLDLLMWPNATAADMWDLNLRGENSAQASVGEAMREAALSQRPPAGPDAKEMVVAANPLDRHLETTLIKIHQQLSHVRGIAGIVWTDIAGNGYVNGFHNGDEYGYSAAGRLAYLRRAQVDPIDIPPYSDFVQNVASLPVMQLNGDMAWSLPSQWRKYRVEGLQRFLLMLRSIVDPPSMPTSQALPFLVAEISNTDRGWPWYGSWDSSSAPLPVYHQQWDDGAPSKFPDDSSKQARMESRLSYAKIVFWPMNDYNTMLDAAKNETAGSSWDGIVANADFINGYRIYPAHVGRDFTPIKLMDNLLDSLHPRSEFAPLTTKKENR